MDMVNSGAFLCYFWHKDSSITKRVQQTSLEY